MNRASRLVLFFLLLMPLVMGVSNLTLLVNATTYNTSVDISSPIQNKTYFTNDIPLSFNYSTDIINSSEYGESRGVVLVYSLDGEVVFDMFGRAHLGGITTRIGQFYEPVPSDYTLSIDVPNGNHSVIVMVTFWFMREGQLISIRRLSQTINFTVSAEPQIPEFSSIYIRSDGSVEGTDKIQRNGNVYTFLENVSIDGSGVDGIIVERDNIVIDGADYTLQLTGEMKISKGITLMERTNVTIKNLRILNFNYGIQLQNSSGNTVFRNYIHPIGIKVNGSHNNTIIENHLVGRGGNGTGIVMDNFPDYGNSTGNHFLGNNITDQAVGINSKVGSANIISGNNITNCTIYGIFLEDYPNSLIIGNNFENNVVGIFFSHSASNNMIYDNNFVNNQKDMDDCHSILPTVYGLSVNNWDNGSRGNYWSIYNGTDNDGDGIGDSPHFVYEKNQDNYPLMNPVDIATIPEFPSMTILLLLLMVIFATVIYKKKLTSKG